MEPEQRRVVVVLRPGEPKRAATVARMLRALIPAAVLVWSPGVVAPPSDLTVVITVDPADVASGPLWLAHALLREYSARKEVAQ